MLYLRNLLNLYAKFSQNVENHVANPLYNFWEPIWNNYSKIEKKKKQKQKTIESVFCSPDYPSTIFLSMLCIFSSATINIVSLFRSSSILGVLWEANMPFEIRHIRGTRKQTCLKILYIFRRSWLIQTVTGPLKVQSCKLKKYW